MYLCKTIFLFKQKSNIKIIINKLSSTKIEIHTNKCTLSMNKLLCTWEKYIYVSTLENYALINITIFGWIY